MTKDKITKILKKVINIGIYLCFLLITCVCISQKSNYHMDEISTYILSNNTYDEALTVNPELDITYDNPSLVWLRSMTVQPGQSFNYANVWNKQKSDVHPPLYYALIHTICSFMPNIYSKWIAGGVNIFFGLCILFLLRCMITELTHSEIACFLGSCCLIFSAGFLSAITFFRMYIATMFWVMLVSYLFLLGLKKRDVKLWLQVGIVSVLGALTHYYFILYLFFICLCFGVYLIVKKEWRNVGVFLLTMLLSGVLCVLIFPSIITHSIGGGYRGVETLNNLQNSSFAIFISRLKSCFDIVNSQLFGGMLLYYVIGAGLILLLFGFVHKQKMQRKPLEEYYKWVILVIPTIAYFFFVSKIAIYITDRYFHPIYPMLIVLLVSMLSIALMKLMSPRFSFVILSLLLGFSTLKDFRSNWFYLYRHSRELLAAAESHHDLNCICFINNNSDYNSAFNEISNYKSVTFVSGYSIDPQELSSISVNTEQGLVIVIGETCDREKVLQSVTCNWPQLQNCELMGQHSATCSYYFYESDV